MRRLIALLVLCAGLLVSGSAALACASAAATGDCCPPGAPPGCVGMYEQLDAALSAACVTSKGIASTPAADCNHGSSDPLAAAGTQPPLTALMRHTTFEQAVIRSPLIDRSSTYLQTGRLRL